MAGKELARNLRQQEPGRGGNQASAVNPLNISHPRNRRHNRGAGYRVSLQNGMPFTTATTGHVAWALDRLRAADECGGPPIPELVPQGPAHVPGLPERGLNIGAVRELHGGDDPEHRRRYVLSSTATSAAKEGAT